MSSSFSANPTENRIKTLMAINILQPVIENDLAKSLLNIIDQDSLPLILTELNDYGLISNENGYYRSTRLGMALKVSNQSKKLRDILRMKYLLKTSKQRGGDFAGR